MSGQGESRERVLGIDVLRAVAVLLVLLHHWQGSGAVAPFHASAWTAPFDVGAALLAPGGIYGVTLFFVISGFVITRSVMARPGGLFEIVPSDFYVRRVARIQPLFAAVVLLGAACLVLAPRSAMFNLVFHGSNRFTPEFWVSLATFWFNIEQLLQGGDHLYWGLHWDVLWSLAVEEQFYLGLPLLILMTRSTRRLTIALLGFVGLGIAVQNAISANFSQPMLAIYNSLCCFDLLALGVLCAMYGKKFQPSRHAMIGIVIIATAWITAAVVIGIRPPLVPSVAFAAALFVLCAQTGAIFRSRIWVPIAWIGRLSYGLYLLNPVVLYTLAPLLGGAPFAIGYGVFAGVCIAFALLSYRCFEQPIAGWIGRQFIARPAALPAT